MTLEEFKAQARAHAHYPKVDTGEGLLLTLRNDAMRLLAIIDAMEAENFIAKGAGADAANKNAAKAPEARDVNTAKTDTFEMVKKRKLGY